MEAFNAHIRLQNPSFPAASLEWGDPEAERAHSEEHFRYFGYTSPDNNMVVHVAKDFGSLPDVFLYGIMAHEFGHLLAGNLWNDWGEEAADEAVEDILGLGILYGTPLEIQYLTCQDVWTIKSAAPEIFG